jgi:superfamily II DNA or RNA helicase
VVSAPGLRPYQLDVMARLEAEIAAGCRRVCLVAPTGSGKTVIAAALIRAARRGERALFLVHRRELTVQSSRKLHDVGVDHGIIQAGFPSRPQAPAQVASIQTLHARAIRGSKIELPPADIVFVDKCHHIRARTYREILEYYPNTVVIGLTATPCRGDGRGLGNVFEMLVESASVVERIRQGHLVGTGFYAPVRPNLKGVKVRRGDYVEGELAERMDQPKLVGDIVEHWRRLGERRRTVVFATGVAHSLHIRDEFRRSGVRAEHINGTTPIEERDAILAQLAAGEINVISNCMVLTEGWDRPEVSCLVLARPTKSLGLYLQMAGRVLRSFAGKANALILDHAGAVFEHGFPDEEIVWTLSEDRRAENRVHGANGHSPAPALIPCPECSAIRRVGRACPACGWLPTRKPKPVPVADGELRRVSRDQVPIAARRLRLPDRASRDRKPTNEREIAPPIDERLAFHRQLTWIAKKRDYKPGWVAQKYREKFGEWPRERHIEPMPPDAATRAWVRSQHVAFVKAQARAAQS